MFGAIVRIAVAAVGIYAGVTATATVVARVTGRPVTHVFGS